MPRGSGRSSWWRVGLSSSSQTSPALTSPASGAWRQPSVPPPCGHLPPTGHNTAPTDHVVLFTRHRFIVLAVIGIVLFNFNYLST